MTITPKVLSLRLKELENEGLVKKKVETKTFPIKSNYRLTESGEDFVKILKGVKRWGLRWKVKNETCDGMNCKDCEF